MQDEYQKSLETRNYSVAAALKSLHPDSKWVVEGNTYEGIQWMEENTMEKPSKAVVEAEVTRLKTNWDNTLYQRQRAAEYPSIQAQLDMQYLDSVNGTTTWADAIQAVKDKYPKP